MKPVEIAGIMLFFVLVASSAFSQDMIQTKGVKGLKTGHSFKNNNIGFNSLSAWWPPAPFRKTGKNRPLFPAYNKTVHKNSTSHKTLYKHPIIKPRVPNKRPIIIKTLPNKIITSETAIVMDGKTGEVLFSLYPDLPRQPASTIKVLTGLIAIERLQKTAMVNTSKRASRMPRSKIYLKRGRSYLVNDLINAVLLSSANDASVALAENIGANENAFATIMTRRAMDMGAKKTVCKNASGLTVYGQQSTARDLAVIFHSAMKNSEFSRRMAQINARTVKGKLLRNHNKALWKVKGAVGGKTGFTRAAGKTYVGKFIRGEHQLIVAIMGSESMWGDIQYLVEYGFNKKKQQEIDSASGAAQARLLNWKNLL
jgi:D-alanyl-D-alanine carboxypeptidase (penicillin-binding protein 5/6)